MEIPLLWIIATTLSSIWTQRQEGKICAAKTRAQLEARCRLLREGRGTSFENCSPSTQYGYAHHSTRPMSSSSWKTHQLLTGWTSLLAEWSLKQFKWACP